MPRHIAMFFQLRRAFYFIERSLPGDSQPMRDELRAQGAFRDDLFYRLCSDVIVVPPLRERLRASPGEIEQLVEVLVGRAIGSEAEDLTGYVLEILDRDLPAHYPWPGNVRELEQAAHRVLLTGAYTGDRPKSVATPDEAFLAAVGEARLDVDALVNRYCALLYRRFGTYVEVARRTGLDRRTVRRHVDAATRAGRD